MQFSSRLLRSVLSCSQVTKHEGLQIESHMHLSTVPALLWARTNPADMHRTNNDRAHDAHSITWHTRNLRSPNSLEGALLVVR